MQKDYITIAGNRYRVEVNWNALTAYLEARGTDSMEALANIGHLRASDIAPLLAACIEEGERLEGRTVKLSALDIGAKVGLTEVSEFLNIYLKQSSPQIPAESQKPAEDETKKA